jgi:hypothetical protein
VNLTDPQTRILDLSLRSHTFLSGPAGSGKTTVAVEHLRALLSQGISADSILLLTPQRTLQAPFQPVLDDPSLGPGGLVSQTTVGGLARRMVELFWPLVGESAGFAHPERPPIYLNAEIAQYYMGQIVRPLHDQGFFASLTMDQNRLYQQISDNLAKAAAVGFPYTEIGQRLTSAWAGDPSQGRVYADAQECASRFRHFCLEHNLVDFSLVLDLFWNQLWRTPECSEYLLRQYKHLIYDNVEEDFPVAHDLLSEWLPSFDTALLVYDLDGGFRSFLSADPDSALRFGGLCENQVELTGSFIASAEIQALEEAFTSKLLPAQGNPVTTDALAALSLPPAGSPARFFPQMIDWVTEEIRHLIQDEGLPASEIVVLAPFLSDALRFSLSTRLEELKVPWRSHRPSRSLREEPASHSLLTLAELAHPGWGIRPTKFDVAYAFLYCIEGMDLVRAQLLADIVYRIRDFSLSSFSAIRLQMRERITFVFGERYETLRTWLEQYRTQPEPDPLDHFLRRLFGEVLSQPGFGFHRSPDGGRTASSLIDSIKNFRQVMESVQPETAALKVGREYLNMLSGGVLPAQYLEAWLMEPNEAILLAPAYTFLMMNRPVSVQFWLDVGSVNWWQRLYQPLTHPYVLTREWDPDRLWTDADEEAYNQHALTRLLTGLLRRCRSRVYLGLSDLSESGFEQRGPLLKTIWKMQLESQSNQGK